MSERLTLVGEEEINQAEQVLLIDSVAYFEPYFTRTPAVSGDVREYVDDYDFELLNGDEVEIEVTRMFNGPDLNRTEWMVEVISFIQEKSFVKQYYMRQDGADETSRSTYYREFILDEEGNEDTVVCGEDKRLIEEWLADEGVLIAKNMLTRQRLLELIEVFDEHL